MTTIERLALACPPMLVEALGYQGGLRHVAFWLSGDSLQYADGDVQGQGSLDAWLTFIEHDSVWPHVIGYGFGSATEAATHWLLVDRDERTLAAGPPPAVGRFLAMSVPEEVRRRHAEQALAVQDERLARARLRMLRDAAFLDRLRVWLDTGGRS